MQTQNLSTINEIFEDRPRSVFSEYMDRVKPGLDLAFKKRLRSCLRSIPMNEAAYLMESLEAGKKIRGCLTCMIAEALGSPAEAAIPMAVAVELIHTATLIHDDYVDQHITRRNRLAPWTLEGARRAVLIGDMLVATTMKMMSDMGREEARVISHAVALLSRGALYETFEPFGLIREIESNRFRDNLYERIIYLKTGILFGAACQLGAIAAKSTREFGMISFRYGVNIGEAYQIADDMADIEHCLKAESFHPEEIAALTPALLYFLKEVPPFLLAALRGNDSPGLSREMKSIFYAVLGRMSDVVRIRLESTGSGIGARFPNNAFLRLIKQAPWDLVRIFTESELG